jgi:hypothetical protein
MPTPTNEPFTWGATRPKKERTKTTQSPTPPEGVRVQSAHFGWMWRTEQKETSSFMWVPATTAPSGRSLMLTDEEEKEVILRGLTVEKAQQLKKVWFSGASISETANILKDARGFQNRTISKYYSIFNHFLNKEA